VKNLIPEKYHTILNTCNIKKLKVSVLLFPVIYILLFPGLCHSEEGQRSLNYPDSAYAMIGGGKEFSYFIAPKEARASTFLFLKLPVISNFGIEAVYAYYFKPAAEYSIGTNQFLQNRGDEEYYDVRLDLLYYFPFCRNFQFKLGLNYSKFNSGFFTDDPSIDNCGDLYNMCQYQRENFFSLNIGFNLDLHLYRFIYAATTVGYRYFFSDNTTKKGALNFGLGIGVKLFSLTGSNKNDLLISDHKPPSIQRSQSYNREETVSKEDEEKNRLITEDGDPDKKASEKVDDNRAVKNKELEKEVPEKEKASSLKPESEKTNTVTADKPLKPLSQTNDRSDIVKPISTETNERIDTVQPVLTETNKEKITLLKPEIPMTSQYIPTNLNPEQETNNRSAPAIKPITDKTDRITAGLSGSPSGPLDVKIENDPDIFSPDGDGVRDVVTFSSKISGPTNIKEWKIVIKDNEDKIVQELKGTTFPEEKIIWDGRDISGKIIPQRSKFKYSFYAKDSFNREAWTSERRLETDHYLVPYGKDFKIDIRPIEFDFNKSIIKQDFYDVLDRAVQVLRSPSLKNRKIRIEGHTDSTGTEVRNTVLSGERAKVVADYIIKKGINKDLVSYEGFGMERPIASNETEEGRQKNRRTEIIILVISK